MPKSIQCSKGLFAVVDDEDYDKVAQHSWWVQPSGSRKTHYAYSRLGHSYGKHTAMHRYLLGLKRGDTRRVDHVNGNGLDNRKKNLRIAETWQNHANAGRRRHNTTGFKCVELTRHGTWAARITANGKRRNLGSFKTPEEAAFAYDQASKEIHGQFAQTNEALGLFQNDYDGSVSFDECAKAKEEWDDAVIGNYLQYVAEEEGRKLRLYIAALEARIRGLETENDLLKAKAK